MYHLQGCTCIGLMHTDYYYWKLARYPLRGHHQGVDLYEINDNNFNYYHYQTGSNIIIVYCKHITHARMHTRTLAHTHQPPSPFRLSLFDGSVEPNDDGVNAPFRRFRWRSLAGRCFIQTNSHAGDSVFAIGLGVFRV